MKTKQVILPGVTASKEKEIDLAISKEEKEGWRPIKETYNFKKKQYEITFERD